MVRFTAAALIALSFFGARVFGAEMVMHTITLSWDPSESASVAGYKVYYGEHSGAYDHIIDVGNRTSTDVANLINGTTYYFGVTAYDASGNESVPAEIHYLPNPAVILNVSTRAYVQTADRVMVVGFIVGGVGQKKIVVRVLGPTLGDFGLSDVLPDSTLSVYAGDQLLASNDDWRDGDAAELERFSLAPPNDLESALVLTLGPGNYSAVVRGKYKQSGLALVEVYDAGPADAP